MRQVANKSLLLFWVLFCLIFLFYSRGYFADFAQKVNFEDHAARDTIQLHHWSVEKTPPKLGPFAMGIFESAWLPPWYFYLIYPAYLISGQSYTYLYLSNFFYTWLTFFLIAVLVQRRENRWAFLLLMSLACFSPLMMQNNNYLIWNPSFVWQPILLAFYLVFLEFKNQKISKICTALSAVLIVWALALGLLAGAAALGLLAAVIILKRDLKLWLLSFLVSTIILFVIPMMFLVTPTVGGWRAFTLRTDYVSVLEKIRAALQFGVGGMFQRFNLQITIIFLILTCVLIIYCLIKKKTQWRLILALTSAYLLCMLVTILVPNRVYHWYMLGSVLFFWLLIAFCPSRLKYFLLGTLLVIFYWQTKFSFATTDKNYTFADYRQCLAVIGDDLKGQQVFNFDEEEWRYRNHNLDRLTALTQGGQLTADPHQATAAIFIYWDRLGEEEFTEELTDYVDDFYQLARQRHERCSENLGLSIFWFTRAD